MKIEKFSAWTEMVSSLAVLGTLIYLVIQTNQNAEAIKGATRQDMLASEVQFLDRSFNKPEIAGLQFKENLTLNERTMVANYVLTFMRIRENNFLQYQNGVLDERTWQAYKASISMIVGSENARMFWQNWAIEGGVFDAEFIKLVDDIIKETPIETQNLYHKSDDQNPGASAEMGGELTWLTGCWQTADGATTETWSAGADTHMFGQAVTVKDGAVSFFETLNLVKSDAGYTLSAYPMGKGPSDFPSVEMGDNTITFENPDHDYPQRITYTREGNTLTGTISLADGSKPNAWVYQKCAR